MIFFILLKTSSKEEGERRIKRRIRRKRRTKNKQILSSTSRHRKLRAITEFFKKEKVELTENTVLLRSFKKVRSQGKTLCPSQKLVAPISKQREPQVAEAETHQCSHLWKLLLTQGSIRCNWCIVGGARKQQDPDILSHWLCEFDL